MTTIAEIEEAVQISLQNSHHGLIITTRSGGIVRLNEIRSPDLWAR